MYLRKSKRLSEEGVSLKGWSWLNLVKICNLAMSLLISLYIKPKKSRRQHPYGQIPARGTIGTRKNAVGLWDRRGEFHLICRISFSSLYYV